MYVITNLDHTTRYNLTIAVVLQSIVGNTAATYNYTVPEIVTASAIPVNMTHVTVTIQSPATTNAVGLVRYEVKVMLTSDNSISMTTACSSSGCDVDVTSVGVPGSDLTVKVYALLDVWRSLPAVVDAHTIPMSPESLSVTSHTCVTMQLSWVQLLTSQSQFDDYQLSWGQTGELTPDITMTTADVSDLVPGTEYTFALKTHKVFNGVDVYSEPITVTDTTNPYNVGSLSADVTDTSVTLSWALPSLGGYSQFEIMIDGVGTEYTTGTSQSFSGLSPGTSYTVQVTTLANQGAASETTNSTSLIFYTVPTAPASVVVDTVDTSSVSVTWSQVAEYQYVVTYELLSDVGTQVSTSCTNSGCVLDLSSVASYVSGQQVTVHVTANVGASASLTTTQTGYTEPLPPSNLGYAERSDTTIWLTWQQVSIDSANPQLDGYTITWSDGITSDSVSVGRNTVSRVLSNLTPGTMYDLTMVTTHAGHTSTSVSLSVRTNPRQATNIVATVTQTTAAVTWDAPTGVIDTYTVSLAEISGSEGSHASDNRQASFSNLLAGSMYTVVIISQAHATLDATYNHTTMQFYTKPNAPVPAASTVSAEYFIARWTPPPSGDYTKTEIVVYESDCTTVVVSDDSIYKPKTEYNVTSLTPGTRYCIALSVVVGNSALNYLHTETASTYTTTTAPYPIRNLKATNKQKKSVKMTWSLPSSGGYDGFYLTYTVLDTYYTLGTYEPAATATSQYIGGLYRGIKYVINVWAYILDVNGNRIYSQETVKGFTTLGVLQPVTETVVSSTAPLYAFGADQADTSLFAESDAQFASTNSYAREIDTGLDIPFNDDVCSKCHMTISSSGYVAFRSSDTTYNTPLWAPREAGKWTDLFSDWRKQANRITGLYVFAPLFSDVNFVQRSPNSVHYQIYQDDGNTRFSTIKNQCKNHVQGLTTYGSWKPTVVITITWERVIPVTLNADGTASEATFQVVLCTDLAKKTFALYNYANVYWAVNQAVMVGYYLESPLNEMTAEYTDSYFSNLGPNLANTNYRKLDTRANGATGTAGFYFYQVGSANTASASDRCNTWYNNEKSQTPVPGFESYTTPAYLTYINDNYWMRLACPCTFAQADADSRWTADGYQSAYLGVSDCFYQTTAIETYTSKTCCYNSNGGLITAQDKTSGYLYLFHPQNPASKGYHRIHDQVYYDFCCGDNGASDCDKWFELRPNDDCSNYIEPNYSWSQGDPHITTLDAHRYTFNGLGEYTMVQSNDDTFTLQARTMRMDSGVDATVFSVIVAKDGGDLSDPVQVEMDADRQGLHVYAAYMNITDTWFNLAQAGDLIYNFTNVVLTKVSSNAVKAAFNTGFTLHIQCTNRQLVSTVSAPDSHLHRTKGLLGVYNGQTGDEFTRKNGTTVSINATESAIYEQFGEQWRTWENESLFMYHESQNYTDFVPESYTPVYLTDLQAQHTVAEWSAMTTACNGNSFCLYDYAATGDESFALATLQVDLVHENLTALMANHAPTIGVSNRMFNLTYNEAASFTVSVTDDDGDHTTFTATLTRQSDGVDFSNELVISGNTVSWTPVTTDHMDLRLNAVDSQGAPAAEVQILLRLCQCASGQGACNWDTVTGGQTLVNPFQDIPCVCMGGWTGIRCLEDIDGCGDIPCGCVSADNCTGSGTTCTDVPAGQDMWPHGGQFICGDCNAGFEKRDSNNPDSDCINSNECVSGVHTCTNDGEACIDTYGSFQCGCATGYRTALDGVTCQEIDECTERSDNCEHVCINVLGSYECECEAGYNFTDVNGTMTCVLDLDLEDPCANQGCDFCRQVNSVDVECYCPDGFTAQVDGMTCQDIDECSLSLHICDLSVSTCNNTDGGYDCLCNDGYALDTDGRTCTGCEAGWWGPGCNNLCQCIGTCDVLTGCAECADPRFTGGNCDEDVDECLTDPCGANTTGCVNMMGTYSCTCLTGYVEDTQTTCIVIDSCESSPCQNGAQCNNVIGADYTCDCVYGFTGEYCETNIDECAAVECENGGTCIDIIGDFRCTCPAWYKGRYCETFTNPQKDISGLNIDLWDNVVDTSSGGSTTYMIIGIILGLLALLAVIGLIIYLKKRKRKSEDGMYDEKEDPEELATPYPEKQKDLDSDLITSAPPVGYTANIFNPINVTKAGEANKFKGEKFSRFMSQPATASRRPVQFTVGGMSPEEALGLFTPQTGPLQPGRSQVGRGTPAPEGMLKAQPTVSTSHQPADPSLQLSQVESLKYPKSTMKME